MSRVIYIAGAIAAPTAWQREQNIRRAEVVALEVWRLGAVPICPHTACRFYAGELPTRIWLEGDLELLRRCDAVLLVPGWEASHGTAGELDEAHRCGMPVFTELRELRVWMEKPLASSPEVRELTAKLDDWMDRFVALERLSAEECGAEIVLPFRRGGPVPRFCGDACRQRYRYHERHPGSRHNRRSGAEP